MFVHLAKLLQLALTQLESRSLQYFLTLIPTCSCHVRALRKRSSGEIGTKIAHFVSFVYFFLMYQ